MTIEYEILTKEGKIKAEGEQLTEHLAARDSDGWCSVDHLASGCQLARVGTLNDARAVAESIEPLIDWDKLGAGDCKDANSAAVPSDVIDYLQGVRYRHRVPRFGEPWPKPPKVKIQIVFRGEVNTDARELWPDGDWPDEITEQSIRDLIDLGGGELEIIRTWYVDIDTRVTIQQEG